MFSARREIWLPLTWLPLWLLAFWPTLVFLWEKWTQNVWHNGHGFFVPVLVAFIVHFALTRREYADEEPSAWGFVFLGTGLALATLDAAIKTELLAAVALVISLPGIALLLLGVERSRALLFPWLLSFFMLPIPSAFLSQLHMTLRLITTQATAPVLELFGIPHLVHGTTIELPAGPVEVVDGCSGFSALYAAVTIALVLIYMTQSPRRRLLLAFLPFPLAIGFNVVRVAGMVLLCQYYGFAILDTWIHTFLGWACFVGTLFVLFAFADQDRPPRTAT